MYARFTSAGPLPSVLLNFLSSLVMPVVTQPPNSVNFSDDEDSASDRWNLRIDELLDNRVPESTKRVNNWAETKFASWLRTTNFPYQNFDDVPLDRLNYLVERFLCDVGDTLKMRSMYSVITALNRNLKERTLDQDFFETKRYSRFRKVFDGWCKEKQHEGAVEPVKKSGYITVEDEDEMWDCGALGLDNPKQLLTTVIFLLCKTFTLRGGDELKQLKSGNITITRTATGWQVWYRETKSKNKQPGLANINKEQKVVQHFDYFNNPRSFTQVYQFFLQKCNPKVADRNSNIQLLQHAPALKNKDLAKEPIWYNTRKPLGKNHPRELLEAAMIKAKIEYKERNITIRSVRPSSVHRMAKKGIHPEQMRKRTGHSSLSALNQYTRWVIFIYRFGIFFQLFVSSIHNLHSFPEIRNFLCSSKLYMYSLQFLGFIFLNFQI